jgi:hypothetical protein
MTNTSNHGWEIPDVNGSKDVWGQILNDFFDDELDRQVKLEGTFANRPSAGSSSVKYYHATDRRIVYYNDGNTWEAVYGLGTDSNPVPGTSHFESISTDSLTLSGDSVGIERGVVADVQGPSAASDATMDTQQNVAVSVTFDDPFGVEPVAASASWLTPVGGVNVEVVSVTQTGLEARIFNYGTSDRSTLIRDLVWLAVGPR